MSSRFDKGFEIFKEIMGEKTATQLMNSFSILPEFEHLAMEFAFGDVYSRPGLDRKMRQLVIVSSLVTQKADPSLMKVHIRAGINVGLSQAQILEAILQVIPYAGFPSVSVAVRAASEIFKEMDAEKQ